LAALEPSLNPGLVAVVARALVPDREGRFATALEMRLALAPFAGALSHAGRLAASAEPVVHSPAAPAVSPSHVGQNQTGPSQAFDPGRAVPKTLPPDADPGQLDAKGTTQRVSDEAVREALRASALPGNLPDNFAYQPTALGQPPSPAPHRRRSRTGLWVTLSLLLILLLGGGALAAVFYQQHQPDSSDAPLVADVPTPETNVSPLIDAGATTQIQPNTPAIAPVTPGRPSNPVSPGTPATGPTVIRPADAGAPTVVDAGRNNTFPFPFPLPSTLPPLPSNFPSLPKTFPTTFPTALPSGFPVIPGFPFARPVKRDGG
jgi:hypothetical protein